jgi:hypothetical protein
MWQPFNEDPQDGLAAVVQVADGTNTMTFTMANLTVTGNRMPFEGDDGAVVWALEMSAEPNMNNSLAITYS